MNCRRTACLLVLVTGLASLPVLAATRVVNTLANEFDTPSGPKLSLREAIRDSAAGDQITFATALNGGTMILDANPLGVPIPLNLTIDASGLPNGLTLSGNHAARIFTIVSECTLTVRGLELAGGSAPEGGAIQLTQNASLIAEDCTFRDNNSSQSGGAIHNLGHGDLTLTRCTFLRNESNWAGGATYSALGPNIITIGECVFQDNIGGSGGGGLYLSRANLQIDHCLFTGNRAGGNGGGNGEGLGMDSTCHGTIENTTFRGNIASKGGGFSTHGTTTASNCTIT